jgi:hypothetical protein
MPSRANLPFFSQVSPAGTKQFFCKEEGGYGKDLDVLAYVWVGGRLFGLGFYFRFFLFLFLFFFLFLLSDGKWLFSCAIPFLVPNYEGERHCGQFLWRRSLFFPFFLFFFFLFPFQSWWSTLVIAGFLITISLLPVGGGGKAINLEP